MASRKKAAKESLARAHALISEEMLHFRVLSITPREVRFRYYGNVYTFKYSEGDIALVNSPWLSNEDFAFFHWWAKALMEATLAGFKKDKTATPPVPPSPQLTLFAPAQLPMHSQRKK